MRTKILISIVFFQLLVITFNVKSQNITITRDVVKKDCITGFLRVNGNLICVTLELPWSDNSPEASCIPYGTYYGNFRYDKSDKWRIQLLDVPKRSNVQIHIGNYPWETTGCILVGTSADPSNCTISGSKAAYELLRQAFIFSEGGTLRVTFE